MPLQTQALEVISLVRRFGDRTALGDVTFSVPPGEIFALLGPNGGGKTTLFRILSTLLPPSAGDARVFGRSVVRSPREVRRHLGVVFQSPGLDAYLSVLDNLLHHGHMYGLHGRDLRDRAADRLRRLGVEDRARDLVGTLSGGLARRVELAKGILHRPPLLLLDEPSTGLDPSARIEFMGVLSDLRRREEVTIVLTTHFLEEAEKADRVGILGGGRLVSLGSPEELRASIGGDVVTLRSGEPTALREKIASRFGLQGTVVSGSVRVEAPHGHQLLRDAVEAFPGEILSASFGRPTLEDVFVHHTGHRLEEAAAGERR